jgi:cellulose synthase/poly-beta-1,6-N-acetylglucosamine synthase-like glycosyltransferase
LLELPSRGGKAAALNAAMRQIRSEIVILSDANTDVDPAAAVNLTRWFANPQVGVVCGRLVLTDPVTGKNADGLYWRYETFLKKCEARLGALLGSNGAIYAIRRDLFVPIPPETIVDDFVIPLLAKSRFDCRIIYDCEAIANEWTPRDIAHEFRRRVRIGAGGFQAIGLLWRLMDPRRGWLALAFFCHKVLRWICPFALALMFGSTLLLLNSPTYRLALTAQLAFYAVSGLATFLPSSKSTRPLRLATMFTTMNAALAVGFWRWMNGIRSGAWETTPRAMGEAFADAT